MFPLPVGEWVENLYDEGGEGGNDEANDQQQREQGLLSSSKQNRTLVLGRIDLLPRNRFVETPAQSSYLFSPMSYQKNW